MENVVAQRADIEGLVSRLESVIRDVEGSVEAMRIGVEKGVDGLRAEGWEMEQDATAAG